MVDEFFSITFVLMLRNDGEAFEIDGVLGIGGDFIGDTADRDVVVFEDEVVYWPVEFFADSLGVGKGGIFRAVFGSKVELLSYRAVG